MTTLGFGDIALTSDTGRVFSIVVLLSGVVFLLVADRGITRARYGICRHHDTRYQAAADNGLSVVGFWEHGKLRPASTA